MSIISQMNYQNPWWTDKGKIHEDSGVMKAVASKPRFFPSISAQSTLIMGPRQVGKTTFMKTTIMKLLDEGVEPTSILFFSCDSLRDRKQLIELLHDYRSFINSGKAHIFGLHFPQKGDPSRQANQEGDLLPAKFQGIF